MAEAHARFPHLFSPLDVGPIRLRDRAIDDLRRAIEAAGLEFHVVGDCAAPRGADIAMAEVALAARAI